MSFKFFFSSRRRHTRWPRDWSSDVCSSDLAISDSNPMAAEAVALGLESDIAQALINQTVIGEGQMLAQSDETARDLRENVTSPNGTHEAGLNTLAAFDLQTAIRSCVNSAANRATILGKK